MTDGAGENLRDVALDVLLEATERGAYLDRALGMALEKYRYLAKRDRAFLTRLAEGTVQRMIEIDYVLGAASSVPVKKMRPVVRAILRLAAYQLLYMDSVPDSAACNEAVKQAKRRGFSKLSGYVNGVARAVARGRGAFFYPDAEKEPVPSLSVRYSMPEWIVSRLAGDLGMERAGEVLAALMGDAPLTARVNESRVTREELIGRLRGEGIEARPAAVPGHPSARCAISLSGVDRLAGLSSFREGLFYVQDVSSMAASLAADPPEGAFCVDVCAAPGGKSLHLAQLAGEGGRVLARDASAEKAALIMENAARLRVSGVSASVFDAEEFDASLEGRADVVMADLPCSGLGVLRRKVDIKYRLTKESVASLAAMQRRILSNAARYVRQGGVLLYATCTISREENEDNVAWLLGENPEFSLEEQRQIFPGEDGGDGFFYARMRRAARSGGL